MRKIEEMIEVMNAYKDGKKIEYKNDGYWEDCQYPTWDWFSNSYRVKPEKPKKRIRPYESDEAFLDAMKEHGPALNIGGSYYIPYCICDGIIAISDGEYSFNMLLESSWQDNTPCGKEVANDD